LEVDDYLSCILHELKHSKEQKRTGREVK
jgi:hypothetical protein